ncbi:MAG: radical SAM protein [Polyangiaceae bacterium]|nr:radical SAM protein [Polyangiaceae bacterium]
MRYEGDIFRPPSEADSILLQATIGCSHNGCRFCAMYRGKRFRARSPAEVAADIAEAAVEYPRRGRVFLCDGDALAMPQADLVAVLEEIRRGLPEVLRVSAYANARSVAEKTDAELRELRALGLRLFHLGLESGDDVTLAAVGKHGNALFHVEQGRRARAVDIKLFVTVLLGLGGIARSEVHALATARALSAMGPEYVGALTLTLVPGTPLHHDHQRGRFRLPPPPDLLVELRTMLEHTDIRGVFYANHASNYLPIRARLPRDRAEALAAVDACLRGEVPLRPEWMRGL